MSDLVTVTGTWLGPDDVPCQGRVILELPRPWPNTDPQRAVSTGPVVCDLDDTGSIAADVVASNDDGWPGGVTVPYVVTVALDGHRVARYQVAILGPGPVDLTTLTPTCVGDDVAIVPVPGPRGEKGDQGDKGDKGDQGEPGTPVALDDLLDVEAPPGAPGFSLIRQPDGNWRPGVPQLSLDGLTNVTAPGDTAPNSLLGTIGDGMTPGQAEWEPLSLDYVQQQVVGPLSGQVHDLDTRLTLLEGTPGTQPATVHLPVDNYAGGFIRIQVPSQIPASFDVVLATTPGPGGAIFPNLGAISGSAAVWADFAGTLGKVQMPLGTDVHGSTIKEWIRRQTVLIGHKDNSDPAHPVLVIDSATVPTEAGSSLTLGQLKDVTAPQSTPAGMLLGTTAQGAWGAVADTGASTAATVGNLLTAAEAGCTVVPPVTQGTVVVDAVGRNGGPGLKLTAASATVLGAFWRGWSSYGTMPITPGAMYTARVSAAAIAATPGASAMVRIYWWRESGTNSPASAPSASGTWVVLTSALQEISVTAVAPADARYASVWVGVMGLTAGDTIAVDECGLWRGAGGDWAMPGVPIVNQGVRSSRPNGTDRLVEMWGNGAWQPVRYTSGKRTVTGGIGLRDNNVVVWTGSEAAPAGFRDTYATGGKVYLTGDPIPSSLPGTPAP